MMRTRAPLLDLIAKRPALRHMDNTGFVRARWFGAELCLMYRFEREINTAHGPEHIRWNGLVVVKPGDSDKDIAQKYADCGDRQSAMHVATQMFTDVIPWPEKEVVGNDNTVIIMN